VFVCLISLYLMYFALFALRLEVSCRRDRGSPACAQL